MNRLKTIYTLIFMFLLLLPAESLAQGAGGQISRKTKPEVKKNVIKTPGKSTAKKNVSQSSSSKKKVVQRYKNKKIDEIVAQLIKIRDMRQSDQRDKLKKNVISEIEKLAKKDHANKRYYTNLIVQLKKDITKSNSDRARGHYDFIIVKLISLKN